MAHYDRLLGFDYGTKRIGVAYGQMITQSAKPLSTIKNTEEGPDWFAIKMLIKKWRPQALIVGLPLNMDNSNQKLTELAQTFSEELEKHTDLPTFLVDERLTTLSARDAVFSQGGYKALRETNIDAYAAKLILEAWMHEQ